MTKEPDYDEVSEAELAATSDLADVLLELACETDGADANAALCEALATDIFCTCDSEESIRTFVRLAADHILGLALDMHMQRIDDAHAEAAQHGGFRQ